MLAWMSATYSSFGMTVLFDLLSQEIIRRMLPIGDKSSFVWNDESDRGGIMRKRVLTDRAIGNRRQRKTLHRHVPSYLLLMARGGSIPRA